MANLLAHERLRATDPLEWATDASGGYCTAHYP
jgi:hypothetical protein